MKKVKLCSLLSGIKIKKVQKPCLVVKFSSGITRNMNTIKDTRFECFWMLVHTKKILC